MERPEKSIRILAPTNEEEWRHADALIHELKEWDVGESRALGFDAREVLSVFVGATMWMECALDGQPR